ncbi:MAG: beta-ketoacyl-[acyl-carrier-protein] synthase family protein [Thermodesulfobacteriota bacterium]
MPRRRVAVTGLGAVSPLGHGVDALFAGLREGRTGIAPCPQLDGVEGLRPRIAGLAPPVDATAIPRKLRRSMSAMSVYALAACREAIAQAGLTEREVTGGDLGLVYGSTLGSPQTMEDFFRQYLPGRSIEQVKSMLFFRVMGHSAAANVAQALGLSGHTLAPAAACATGCMAVGAAFDMVASGRQPAVLCGGCDEFHPLTAATFDIIQAASFRYNDDPAGMPGPFDAGRDGVVCAEGAGALVLEDLERARARGAAVLAEVAGWAGLADPQNLATPGVDAMAACLRRALADAGVDPAEVDYVNAHATGTALGDPAECAAIAAVLGPDAPVSSFKGHLGHTMAASGALELAAVVRSLGRGLALPTRNLRDPDPDCRCVRLLTEALPLPMRVIAKNSFALGGMNAVIILRSYPRD